MAADGRHGDTCMKGIASPKWVGDPTQKYITYEVWTGSFWDFWVEFKDKATSWNLSKITKSGLLNLFQECWFVTCFLYMRWLAKASTLSWPDGVWLRPLGLFKAADLGSSSWPTKSWENAWRLLCHVASWTATWFKGLLMACWHGQESVLLLVDTNLQMNKNK